MTAASIWFFSLDLNFFYWTSSDFLTSPSTRHWSLSFISHANMNPMSQSSYLPRWEARVRSIFNIFSYVRIAVTNVYVLISFVCFDPALYANYFGLVKKFHAE